MVVFHIDIINAIAQARNIRHLLASDILERWQQGEEATPYQAQSLIQLGNWIDFLTDSEQLVVDGCIDSTDVWNIIQQIGEQAIGLDCVGTNYSYNNPPPVPNVNILNYVESVNGLNTNNTDPKNPIVRISVDGLTITGNGTPASPLIATAPLGGVQSVTGNLVNNADPENPVVNSPLTADELAAIQGANAPDGTNVFATLADIAGGGNANIVEITSTDLASYETAGTLSLTTIYIVTDATYRIALQAEAANKIGANGIIIDLTYSGSVYYDLATNTIVNGTMSDIDGNTWNGCLPTATTLGGSSTKNTFNQGATSNTLGNGCSENTFEQLASLNTIGDSCSANTFEQNAGGNFLGIGCTGNTFEQNAAENTLGDNCGDNTFHQDADSNLLGNNCSFDIFEQGAANNVLGDDCSNNTFKQYAANNVLGLTCWGNIFNAKASENTLGDICYYNTFGQRAITNTLGESCNHNFFHQNSCLNELGINCRNNIFGQGSVSNILGDGCLKNKFEQDASTNTLGESCINNTFGQGANGFTFGDDLKNVTIDAGMTGADYSDPTTYAFLYNKDYAATIFQSGSINYHRYFDIANDRIVVTDLATPANITYIGGGGGGGTVTSVDLTMPSAFSVSGNPITTSGTIAVTGAGLTSQYVRGDGSLANFPTSGGGGASVNYYLNGSVSQGTFGGVAMREINKVPIIGTGTDFTISADGYIQSFITDANDPNQLSIPAGNWNFETYFSASSGGGSPSFYIELHKWDGTTLTLIASSSATPEAITGGTAIDLYTTALAVPQTTLALTDRLAIRIYVTHSGRTITLHTENSHLCQVITTFTTGLTALNGLTEQVQTFAVGTTGTDFAISSAFGIHNFNLPTASASNRGALSSADWSAFNAKGTIFSTTTDGAVTVSSTANVYTSGILIPANSFTVGNNVEVTVRGRKTGTAGNMTMRIYVNTTNDISGTPILVATNTTAAANQTYLQFQRFLSIKSASTEAFSNTGGSNIDCLGSNLGVNVLSIDWTNNLYIVVSTQCTVATDSANARSSFIKIKN